MITATHDKRCGMRAYTLTHSQTLSAQCIMEIVSVTTPSSDHRSSSSNRFGTGGEQLAQPLAGGGWGASRARHARKKARACFGYGCLNIVACAGIVNRTDGIPIYIRLVFDVIMHNSIQQ